MALILGGAGDRGHRAAAGRGVPARWPRSREPSDRFRLPAAGAGRPVAARHRARPGGGRAGRSSGCATQAALGSLPYLLMHIARDAATTDRWDDAEAAYQEAIRLAEETGQSTDLAMSLAGLAWLDARRGRAQAVPATTWRPPTSCAGRNNIRLAPVWLDFAQGDLAAGAGDPAAAAEHYEALERCWPRPGWPTPTSPAPPSSSRPTSSWAGATRRRPGGRRLAGQGGGEGPALVAGPGRRGPGALRLGRRGRDATSGPRWRCTRETPDLYETARTELAFGARLRRDRRRVEPGRRCARRCTPSSSSAPRRGPTAPPRSSRRRARRCTAARRTRSTS